MAAGIKAEEVGFQLAFSKAELRKVIKEYPGKEVCVCVCVCACVCVNGLEYVYNFVCVLVWFGF